jgi:hypothetical protein
VDGGLSGHFWPVKDRLIGHIWPVRTAESRENVRVGCPLPAPGLDDIGRLDSLDGPPDGAFSLVDAAGDRGLRRVAAAGSRIVEADQEAQSHPDIGIGQIFPINDLGRQRQLRVGLAQRRPDVVLETFEFPTLAFGDVSGIFGLAFVFKGFGRAGGGGFVDLLPGPLAFKGRWRSSPSEVSDSRKFLNVFNRAVGRGSVR